MNRKEGDENTAGLRAFKVCFCSSDACLTASVPHPLARLSLSDQNKTISASSRWAKPLKPLFSCHCLKMFFSWFVPQLFSSLSLMPLLHLHLCRPSCLVRRYIPSVVYLSPYRSLLCVCCAHRESIIASSEGARSRKKTDQSTKWGAAKRRRRRRGRKTGLNSWHLQWSCWKLTYTPSPHSEDASSQDQCLGCFYFFLHKSRCKFLRQYHHNSLCVLHVYEADLTLSSKLISIKAFLVLFLVQ